MTLPEEIRAFQKMRWDQRPAKLRETDAAKTDGLHTLLGRAAARIEELEGLLTELVAIEGPCPGTGDWAAKVRAAITPTPN